MIKKIILIIIILLFCSISIQAAIINDETIEQTKEDFKFGLSLLMSDELTDEEKQELIDEFADALTKLWVIENSSVENGLFKLYIKTSDIFIDKEGNLYLKSESEGYIKIGTDKYNIEGNITLANKYSAYVPETEPESIFQIEPKLGGVVFTDFSTIDFDVIFLVQILKFKKINIDTGIGMRSLGIKTNYPVTENFDVGIYAGVAYPRDTLKWRPIAGLSASFKF